ncbi:hypothetical protein DFH08DRAFT_816192 [Mycena albidolilacea]|uniref:Uncharacterized protein n=1 Tax=Mycena albidolilacea TaxID=1033008 RepID=A0AAD6ZL20_9AGAR|nr:hypothetical protein DFH08DRAFT_816192 [Mycena albidolilacea]
MNASVSAVQFFRCSLSLVNQTAVFDTQTQKILSVEPPFKKTASTWASYTAPSGFTPGRSPYPNGTTNNLFIDAWEQWHNIIPAVNFDLDYIDPSGGSASAADIYLIQALNLPAANHSDTPTVKLHDVENAFKLSTVIASMF